MSKTKIKAKVVATKGKGSVKPKLRDSSDGGIFTAKVASIISKRKKSK